MRGYEATVFSEGEELREGRYLTVLVSDRPLDPEATHGLYVATGELSLDEIRDPEVAGPALGQLLLSLHQTMRERDH